MSDSFKPKGCDAVNNHISKPIPATLWHYTSFEGLRGIITSQKIWATEHRFLNDLEEVVHARTLALELVEQEPEVSGEGFSARDMMRKTVNIALNTGSLREDRLRIMVASFSEREDQLSQWRAYAGNSTGVSIGFDLQAIRPASEIGTAVVLAPCIYKDSDKRTILKAVIAHHRNEIQGWWDSFVTRVRKEQSESGRSDPQFAWKLVEGYAAEPTRVISECVTSLKFDLLRIAPLLKNEAFFEEAEWRLVLPLQTDRLPTLHPIQFRSSYNTLVPYVAYPLQNPNQKAPFPCNGLILGPGFHQSAEVAVNLFFETPQIRVLAQRSKVPYRPAAR